MPTYLKKDSLGRTEIVGSGEFRGVVGFGFSSPWKKLKSAASSTKRFFTGSKTNEARLSVRATAQTDPAKRFVAYLQWKRNLSLGRTDWMPGGRYYAETAEKARDQALDQARTRKYNVKKISMPS